MLWKQVQNYFNLRYKIILHYI